LSPVRSTTVTVEIPSEVRATTTIRSPILTRRRRVDKTHFGPEASAIASSIEPGLPDAYRLIVAGILPPNQGTDPYHRCRPG
jgi:hypothetical protein